MPLHVVGVRHHSPACARLVEQVIEELRPATVLIEGPADMNSRMDELVALEHRLPIAIFSYYHDEQRTHASWTPLCDYSPEWVALQSGRKAGAEVLFMDLPAWSEAFAGVRNRYSDGERRTAEYIRRLCLEVGADGMDALWDHLFEQPLPRGELGRRLEPYFSSVRGDDPPCDRDGAREAFMAQCVRHSLLAAGEGRAVVVVCGGYHKPALERACAELPGSDPGWPELPQPAPGARQGSYLVPYTFARLDSFTGYESGMPSPAYYQTVWKRGPKKATEAMLEQVVRRLRGRSQPVSSADLIATLTMTEGLALVRGHSVPSRADLLDGIAAALVKDAQDVPLPWTERGTLRVGTHPLLVEVVAALSGEAEGKLDPRTPRPPLLADVQDLLDAQGLTPPEQGQRTVDLDLTEQRDVERSRLLHQLKVLKIPGFERQRGPDWATDPVLSEQWSLRKVFETESALIEAAAYGSTLRDAAAARIAEVMVAAGNDLSLLSALLGEAVFIGIDALAEELLERVARQARAEPQIERLGPALGRLLGLWRHDTLLGSKGSAGLGKVIEAAFDRGLWLFEALQGPTAAADDNQIRSALALRDTVRFASAKLDVSGERAAAVMQRRSVDSEAPPAVRGAALGFLWSMAHFADAHEAVKHALMVIRSATQPKIMGDFLAGLFALAREEVMRVEVEGGGEIDGQASGGPLLSAIDSALGMMESEDFLVAIPALRNAFSYFPPREKDLIARAIIVRHGGDPSTVRSFRKLDVTPGLLIDAAMVEAQVDELMSRYGLDAAEGGDGAAEEKGS